MSAADELLSVARHLTPHMRAAVLSKDAGNLFCGNGGVSYALQRAGLLCFKPTKRPFQNRSSLTDRGIAVRALLLYHEEFALISR
jgi:hypothetical protein